MGAILVVAILGLTFFLKQNLIEQVLIEEKLLDQGVNLTHELKPIEPECLNLPTGFDRHKGCSGYKLRQGEGAIDRFEYRGTLESVALVTVEQSGKVCPYYQIQFKEKLSPIYLPENLVSVLTDEGNIAHGQDGQEMRQQTSREVKLLVEFEEQAEEREKYFSWGLILLN